MVGLEPQIGGDVSSELAFHLKWRVACGKPHAVGHTKDVGVDSDSRFAKYQAQHHVCGFASHAGQRHEFLHGVGHATVELVDEHRSHVVQMLRFAIRIGHALDVAQDIVHTGACHGLWSGVGRKERWRDKVHALVGALCRKHYSNQNFYRKYLWPEFNRYPLWIANYSRVPVVKDTRPVLWQRGDTGHVHGIWTYVDIDQFINGGSLQDLLIPDYARRTIHINLTPDYFRPKSAGISPQAEVSHLMIGLE